MKEKFPVLDGMRGVAAIMVVVFHMGFWFPQAIFPKAYLAVDLFFCLSGFVVAHAYSRKLLSGMSFGEFFAVRLIRLYPLYLLGTFLGLFRLAGQILSSHPNAPSPLNFVISSALAIFMLPSWSPRFDLYPANTVAWSLAFEILVNLAYALVLPFLNIRRIILIAAVSGIALLVCGMLNGDFEMGPFWGDFAGTTFRTIFSFSMGLIVYHFRHAKVMALPPFVIMCLVALFLGVPLHGAVLYDAIFCAIIAPTLVLIGSASGKLDKKYSFCIFFGVISYPLYMIHTPFVSAIGNYKGKIPIDTAYLAIITIFLLVVISFLLEKIYDMPMRKFLGYLVGKRRATSAKVNG